MVELAIHLFTIIIITIIIIMSTTIIVMSTTTATSTTTTTGIIHRAMEFSLFRHYTTLDHCIHHGNSQSYRRRVHTIITTTTQCFVSSSQQSSFVPVYRLEYYKYEYELQYHAWWWWCWTIHDGIIVICHYYQ